MNLILYGLNRIKKIDRDQNLLICIFWFLDFRHTSYRWTFQPDLGVLINFDMPIINIASKSVGEFEFSSTSTSDIHYIDANWHENLIISVNKNFNPTFWYYIHNLHTKIARNSQARLKILRFGRFTCSKKRKKCSRAFSFF